jgi:purine catabolism regulator
MSSTAPPPISSASVRNILTLLVSRDAYLVAGSGGLERRVTWACRMRARLPAFESVRGGELALLGLAQLRRLDETLPHLLRSLHKEGVAAVAIAATSDEALGNEARVIADQLHLPLILLPSSAPLEEIEREVITFVVSFRSEVERKATEIAHQLMQLSAQGAGIQGICTHLARICGRWIIVQDADHEIRFRAAPPDSTSVEQSIDIASLPSLLSDETLEKHNLVEVSVPILIRHEIAGYLSLVGNDDDFDYLERLILGQVAPILALEFVRERERSEVESRYHLEAFMDVLQGNYQQPEEMLTRARLLGYDLTTPQAVAVFELPSVDSEPSSSNLYWNRRLRDELLRAWPTSWVLTEPRRVTALLPLTSSEDDENTIFTRLQRVYARAQHNNGNASLLYSGGMGHIAKNLQGISQSLREAQQALEIGQLLFGDGQLHSFARLGIYRLLFHLHEQTDLADFYQETLGPLLEHDTRRNGTFIETLEEYFRCNGNLSETARAMHLHRNALLYRLGRIEEILGQSLEDSELRLSLQIALKT